MRSNYVIRTSNGGLVEVLDVFGLDFDGGGDEAGDFDDEAALARAANVEEAAGVAIEWTTDDGDFFAVHFGGDFVDSVVANVGDAANGFDEAIHIDVAHGHGFVDGVTTAVAILQRGYELDYGVKVGFERAYEEEVCYDRHLPACAPAGFFNDLPAQGGEYLEAAFAELKVCGIIGITSLKVA